MEKKYLFVSCYNDSNTHETWFENDYIYGKNKQEAIENFKHTLNGKNTIINIIEL